MRVAAAVTVKTLVDLARPQEEEHLHGERLPVGPSCRVRVGDARRRVTGVGDVRRDKGLALMGVGAPGVAVAIVVAEGLDGEEDNVKGVAVAPLVIPRSGTDLDRLLPVCGWGAPALSPRPTPRAAPTEALAPRAPVGVGRAPRRIRRHRPPYDIEGARPSGPRRLEPLQAVVV